MPRAKLSVPWWWLVVLHAPAFGRGVSPYLPLNLEPQIERSIERVLILADKPVMTRPIAAATVLDALSKACQVDEVLCRRVQHYLARYTHNSGVIRASLEGAVTSGANTTVNRYGMGTRSAWAVSADAYLQPSDHLLLSLGGVAYEGKTDPTGSIISLGFSFAQLDLGYRPHWFSPLTDSGMLMSTEAPTMPSATISNYSPLTRLGLQYELFLASMSRSDRIFHHGDYLSSRPRLAGLHLAIEPLSGWSLALNRLVQFVGGSSPKTVLLAFVNPSVYSNTSQSLTVSQKATNQEASFTSRLIFPGRIPFSVYAEYAGEDTSRGRNYLLGEAALSVGIHFPRLWERFDFTYEISEWQNTWYTHSIFQDGMVNDGHVTGHWFGDQRVFGNGVGGQSHMVRLGWEPRFGGQVDVRYRTLQNQSYFGVNYQRLQDLTLGYCRPWRQYTVGGELEGGQDVFGKNFTRLAAFVRYGGDSDGRANSIIDPVSGSGQSNEKAGEVFVDAGANTNAIRIDLTDGRFKTSTARKSGSHFALGARRFVSDHSDLGARVEVDDIQGHSLIGFRAVDYRYRFNGPLAASFFIGAARYALRTPAYGIYYGAGLQWRNILHGWDIGLDWRYANSVARDNVLPGDPASPIGRKDSFYDITSATLSISHHF